MAKQKHIQLEKCKNCPHYNKFAKHHCNVWPNCNITAKQKVETQNLVKSFKSANFRASMKTLPNDNERKA